VEFENRKGAGNGAPVKKEERTWSTKRKKRMATCETSGPLQPMPGGIAVLKREIWTGRGRGVQSNTEHCVQKNTWGGFSWQRKKGEDQTKTLNNKRGVKEKKMYL